MIFKLLKELRPFIAKVALIVVLVIVETFTELSLPTMMSDIVDQGVVYGDTGYIIRVGAIMLGITLLCGITIVMSSYFTSKVGVGMTKNIRENVFNKISSYSLHEIDQFGTSSLITRTTNDITQMQNFVDMLPSFLFRAPFLAVGGIIMALQKDIHLTSVIIVGVVMMAIIIACIAARAIPLFRIMQKKIDTMTLVLRERLVGMKVIRAFNKENYENNRYKNSNQDLAGIAIRVNKLMAVTTPLTMLFFNLTTVALIWFGAIRVDAGSMQVGDLMAFIQYCMLIMNALLMLSMIFIYLPRVQVSATRINEVLNVEPEMIDPRKPIVERQDSGLVEFRNVSFSYHTGHSAQKKAINNMSFTSNPGEITAIIGGTGSGKSTLVNLLLRFYDVDEGAILVNAVDVRDMTMKHLREKIGLVPQKTVLFNGTVRDNIRFGKEDASDEKIIEALKVAQGYDFVLKRKNGLDETIAQGGVNLSGGQKQRLSIARALVKKPGIYVFDESFSALDLRTNARLREALHKEIGHATVLIVAKSVATVRDADQIIVIDNGEIAGIGKHDELKRNNQVYSEIILSQL